MQHHANPLHSTGKTAQTFAFCDIAFLVEVPSSTFFNFSAAQNEEQILSYKCPRTIRLQLLEQEHPYYPTPRATLV
jgi:hypothetical protein